MRKTRKLTYRQGIGLRMGQSVLSVLVATESVLYSVLDAVREVRMKWSLFIFNRYRREVEEAANAHQRSEMVDHYEVS